MALTLKDYILNFDKPVPRYTSYPTAPNFKTIDSQQSYLQWLNALNPNSKISLYIHVPFCTKMCWYCGCHTKVTKRYEPVQEYGHLMLREIEILKNHIPHGCVVDHIHFGGGSPGMLQATDFAKIMESVRNNFNVSSSAKIAIEIDPRGVTEGRVTAYAKAGVNRISLGVQDFNEKVLKAVNREQPFHLSFEATKMFRMYGIHEVNIDIMYGLPHQTPQTMQETMQNVLLLNPERIAFFGYAHVPWMKKHMTLIDESALPDKSMRYDMFESGSKILTDAGYESIGIDHFAKPNDTLTIAAKQKCLRRNFQGYTTDATEALIGIGVSSIGKFSQGFVQNSPERPIYEKHITSGELPAAKICTLSKQDNLRAHVIERLMCDFEIDIAAACNKFDFPSNHLDDSFCGLKAYIDAGFVTLSENRFLQVSKEARPALRLVCASFDAYLPAAHDKPRHARAV